MVRLVPALDLRRAGEAPEPSLPMNIEAEQALLGCVLYDNEAFYACEGVAPDTFYEPLHGRLWDFIATTVGKGLLAEPVSVADKMGNDAGLQEFGGIAYLADLVDRAPPAANAPALAAIIVQHAQRRALIRLADGIGKAGREGEAEPCDIIGMAEAELLQMQATSRPLKLISAGAAAAKVLAYLDAPPESVNGSYTGLGPLDEHLGPLLPGDLILGMGRPSMGKSAWAACVALNMACAGRGVIEINGEMSPEEMAQRHLSDLCHARWGARGPKYSDIRRRRIDGSQRSMLGKAAEGLDQLPLHMIKRPGLKLSQLRSIARRQAAEWARKDVPFGALIVDHAGLVKPDQPTRDRYADQTIVSNGMKELADELGAPVIALNQMNRQNEHREDKRPQLSDLRDSGSWEQDADFVIGFYREAYYAQRQPEPKSDMEIAEWLRARNSPTVEAIILKARAGECTTIKLWADVARNAIRGDAPAGSMFDE